MNDQLEKDFKKWILFNNQIENFQNLYDLYRSIASKKGNGGISILIDDTDEDYRMTVEQDGYSQRLEIQGEANRISFLEYLIQHYFPDEDIEEWYRSKVEEKDKSENLRVPSSSGFSDSMSFQVHSKETKYYYWRVFFSGFFYIAILAVIVLMVFDSAKKDIPAFAYGLVQVSFLVAGFLLFLLIRTLVHGFFIGLIQGSSVRLNEQQYPEIYNIVKEQSTQLKLKQIPEVYVLHGHFNAFVTKFARRKHLVLFSEVLETAAKGDFEVVKFVIGHELGHIKRLHLSRELWLTPSNIIPFLKNAHSRGCEYTCDRIGYHCSPKGAIEGILILAAGKEIYSKINASQFIEDSNFNRNFWVWISEKFLTHPHIFKRMLAIKNYAERGF